MVGISPRSNIPSGLLQSISRPHAKASVNRYSLQLLKKRKFRHDWWQKNLALPSVTVDRCNGDDLACRCATAATQTEHPCDHGRRCRLVQHRRLSPGHHVREDAE